MGLSAPTPDERRAAAVDLDQLFDGSNLPAVRAAVAAHADHLRLPPIRIKDLVLTAHELASNAVRHGGGKGRVRLWAAADVVYCEVSDSGPGLAVAPDGWRLPSPQATGGRGLWLVRSLADRFDVRTGPEGTHVTVAFDRRP